MRTPFLCSQGVQNEGATVYDCVVHKTWEQSQFTAYRYPFMKAKVKPYITLPLHYTLAGCLRLVVSGWLSPAGCLWLVVSGWLSPAGCLRLVVSSWLSLAGCLRLVVSGWLSPAGCLRLHSHDSCAVGDFLRVSQEHQNGTSYSGHGYPSFVHKKFESATGFDAFVNGGLALWSVSTNTRNLMSLQ